MGQNAKGGVFNCGKSGDNLVIRCTACPENFFYALGIIQVWTLSALSADSPTTVPYDVDDG